MGYTPIGPQPAYRSTLPSLAEAEAGFGEYIEAAAGNVIRDSPTSSAYRFLELETANNPDPYFTDETARSGIFSGTGRYGGLSNPNQTMSAEQATAKAKDAGVTIDFGTGKYASAAVDIMIDRATRRQVRDSVIASYRPSMGTHLGVSLLTSLADPLNIAAAFIPFAGEARYGALVAEAGGAWARAGVRAGVGALEGAGGAAVVEPLIAAAATQEGQDYHFADSLRNVMFGGAFGAGLHAAAGAIGDKLFKRYRQLRPVETPADIVERIPQEINEAAFRAAISDMVLGRPVQAHEAIDMFMRNDPEAARSISFASTLRRDGPEIDDTLNRIGWWKQKLEGKPSKPVNEDFISWVRSKGGLRDEGGVLEADIGGKVDLPSALYMGARGAKKTTRGMGFDEMLGEAIKEGFVTDRRQFLDALRAGQKEVPIRKQYRLAEEQRMRNEEDSYAHMQMLLSESGVSLNANRTVKSRAIVGREQHLLAAEKARVATAVEKMLARNEEYRKLAEQKAIPPEPFVPDPVKSVVEEVPLTVGDTVNVISGPERIIGTPKPVKLTKILHDERYGTYGFVEGSNTGFPLKDLVRVGEPAAKVPIEKTKTVETPKAETPEPRVYTYKEVTKAIETSLKASMGERVPISRIIDDYLPGLSKNKLQDYLDRMVEERPLAIVKGELFWRKLSTEMKEQKNFETVDRRIGAIRRILDEAYPNLGKAKLYYLENLREYFIRHEVSPKGFAKYANLLAERGQLRIWNEITEKNVKLTPEHFQSDNASEILLQFTEAPRQKEIPMRKRKIEPLTPEEQAKADEGLQAVGKAEPTTNVPPASQRIVETPPAETEALNVEELTRATEQYTKLQTETERRLNAMMNNLPPETAANIRAQLDQIEGDASRLEKMYNEAVTCMLKPKS